MICLIGASASGKSTIEKELVKRGYHKTTSVTTRPPREGEQDGIDYYFVSEDRFERLKQANKFVETTTYRDWHYGTLIKDCTFDSVAVVNPSGFRQLKKHDNLKVVSFYIEVSENERLIRMAKRGDNVIEIFRRVISDQGVFQGMENEVDYTIKNTDVNKATQEIIDILEGSYE